MADRTGASPAVFAAALLLLLSSSSCTKSQDGRASDEPAEEVPADEPTVEEAPAEEAPAEEAPADPEPDGAIELRRLEADELPGELEYDGKLVDAAGWTDANGENAVLFSEIHKQRESSSYLFVRHYALAGDKARQLRLVRDKVEDCPNDITLRFEPRALSVTDLDRDDIGEITFAYWITCRGDVSPDGLKLLVLEDGDKYIIRGRGHWKSCDPDVRDVDPACRDEKKVDPSLEDGPREFLDHALEVWKKVSPQTI